MTAVELVPGAAREVRDLPPRARTRVLAALLALRDGRLAGEPLGGRAGSPLYRVDVMHLAVIFLVADGHLLVTEVSVAGTRDTAARVEEVVEHVAALNETRRREAAKTMADLVAASPVVRRIGSGLSTARRPNLEALEALCGPAS